MTNLLFHAAALAFELDRLGRSSESPITLNCPTTGLLPTVTFWEKNGEDLVSGGTYEITTKLRDRRTTIFDNYLRINYDYNLDSHFMHWALPSLIPMLHST